MRSSRWCAGFVAVAGLAASLLLGASASSAAIVAEATRPGIQRVESPAQLDSGYDWSGQSHACQGLVPYPIPVVYQPYFFCADWRLGPEELPARGVLGSILEGYDRLGGRTAVEFLNAWWLPAADSAIACHAELLNIRATRAADSV